MSTPPSSNLRREQAWLNTGSLVVLAMVAIAFVLFFTQSIMVPFVLAVFIASMTSPVLDFLVLRCRLPRSISVVVTLLLVLAVVAALCLVLVLATQRVQSAVFGTTPTVTIRRTPPSGPADPSYLVRPDDPRQRVVEAVDLVQRTLFGAPTEVLEQDTPSDPVDEVGYVARLSNLVDRGLTFVEGHGVTIEKDKLIAELNNLVPRFLSSVFATAMNVVSLASFVGIFLIFLIAGRDPHVVRSGLYAQLDSRIRSYLVTKFVLSAATGLLVWLSLWLFGLKLAGVFGLLAFLLNFIPSIGSVVATLLPLPMAFAQFDGNWWWLAGVLLVPGAVQMVIGNAIEPKLMGKGMKLHPITIIAMLAFWGILWGPIGMLLAVPITAIVRIVFMHFETLRPLGNLMAGTLPEPNEPVPEATD